MLNFLKNLFKKPVELEIPEGYQIKPVTFMQFLITGFEDEGLYNAMLMENEDGLYWNVFYSDFDDEFEELIFEPENVKHFIISGQWQIEVLA